MGQGNFTVAEVDAASSSIAVFIGPACYSYHQCQSRRYNYKCVQVPGEYWCPSDGGDGGKRLNTDWPRATDSFEISTQWGIPNKVCARRRDYHGGWEMNLAVRCY